MRIKYVVITNGDDFVIHGSKTQTPAEMFKALAPLWDFDPQTDKAIFLESELYLQPQMLPLVSDDLESD
jgi:hypothetical protein